MFIHVETVIRGKYNCLLKFIIVDAGLVCNQNHQDDVHNEVDNLMDYDLYLHALDLLEQGTIVLVVMV